MLTGHSCAPRQPWPPAGQSFTGGVSDSVPSLHAKPSPRKGRGCVPGKRPEIRSQRRPGDVQQVSNTDGQDHVCVLDPGPPGLSHYHYGKPGLCTQFPGSLSPLVTPAPAAVPSLVRQWLEGLVLGNQGWSSGVHMEEKTSSASGQTSKMKEGSSGDGAILLP